MLKAAVSVMCSWEESWATSKTRPLPRQDVVLLAEASRPTTWGVDSGHNEDVLKFFRRYPRRGRAHPLQREWRDGLLLQRC